MGENLKKYPYFVGDVVLQTAYFRFPVALALDDSFKKLSWLERMTYVVLLDKVSYAYRMGKIDDKGRPYIDDFSRKDVISISGCSEETAKRVLRNLGTGKGIGLIDIVARPGTTSLIYVKDFTSVSNTNGTEINSYIYQDTMHQFQYWMLPQIFFTNEEYREMKFESKVIYSLLLSRTALSFKNQWTDDEGRVFIYCSVRDIKSMLNLGSTKIVACLNELVEAGLLTRLYDQAANRERIYVHNFVSSESVRVQRTSAANNNCQDNDKKAKAEEGGQIGNTSLNEVDNRGVKLGTPPTNNIQKEGSNWEHLQSLEKEEGSKQERQGEQIGNTRGVKTGTLGGSNWERKYNNIYIPDNISYKDISSSENFDKAEPMDAEQEFVANHSSDSTEDVDQEAIQSFDNYYDNSRIMTKDDIKKQVSYDKVYKRNRGNSVLLNTMITVMQNVMSGRRTYGVAGSADMIDSYKRIGIDCFESTMMNVHNRIDSVRGSIEPFIAAALYNNIQKEIIRNARQPVVTEDIQERLDRYKDEIRELREKLKDDRLDMTTAESYRNMITIKESGLRLYGQHPEQENPA